MTPAPTVLVDTDVFSYLFKGDSRARAYQSDLVGRALCLSFMSVAELEQWALVRRFGRGTLDRLRAHIRTATLLLPDEHTVRLWAELSVLRRRAGRPVSTADAWIAATALRHGLPLVTHNAQDFTDIQGLTVISRALTPDP